METKANYALVGFFTVLVMAAAFVFVYWMILIPFFKVISRMFVNILYFAKFI